MMKVNDFLKYEISLNISYEDYFRLIYDNKYLIEARLGPDRTFIAKKSIYGNSRKKPFKSRSMVLERLQGRSWSCSQGHDGERSSRGSHLR